VFHVKHSLYAYNSGENTLQNKEINSLEELDLLLKDNGISINITQREQFKIYHSEIVKKNTRINLISKNDTEKVYNHHFVESLSLIQIINLEEGHNKPLILDLGTGAGFPGVPLKIVFPSIRITLLDSARKKTLFLRNVVQKLSLQEVEVICERVEKLQLDINYVNKYDIVVCRAVAKLKDLVTYAFPFLKGEGKLLALKGGNLSEEIGGLPNNLNPITVDSAFGSLRKRDKKIVILQKICNLQK